MNPRVQDVRPLPDYKLELLFTNRERKVFDVRPYLTLGIFSALQDAALFGQVKPFNGTVVWSEELDLDPDTLYLDSTPIN